MDTTYLVDLRQHAHFRPVEYSQRQANHLQVLTAGSGADVAGLGPDIVHDGALQPWDEEVGAFIDDAVLDTVQTVEDDGALTTTDIVDGGGGNGEGDGGGDGETVDLIERLGGHRG